MFKSGFRHQQRNQEAAQRKQEWYGLGPERQDKDQHANNDRRDPHCEPGKDRSQEAVVASPPSL